MTETTEALEVDENPHGDEVAETAVPRRKRRQSKYRVRRYNPDTDNDPVVLADENLNVVRRHVMTHHPRGREVYIEYPDGYREHYSADHAHQGDEPWLEFTEDDE